MDLLDTVRQCKERRPITDGPTPAATEEYRQAVWAAVDGTGPAEAPTTILVNAWRTADEFRRDVATYQGRIKDRHTLDVEGPELQQKAAEAKAAFDRAAQLVNLPLPAALEDIMVDLRAADEAIDASRCSRWLCPKLPPITTIGQLVAALQIHADHGVAILKNYAFGVKTRAEGTIQEARRRLHQTASTETHGKISSVSTQIAQLQGRIQARAEILKVDQDIAKCEARLAELAKGERVAPRGVYDVEYMHRPSVSTTEKYRQERANLDRLRMVAQHRDQAIAENEADTAEIAKLQAKTPLLDEECLVPRNMAWAE